MSLGDLSVSPSPNAHEVVSMLAFLTATMLLAIAFLSIYCYQTSDHEVAKVLAAAAAAVCLIWGFAIAHWGLHLVCLFLLLRYKFPLKLKPVAIDK